MHDWRWNNAEVESCYSRKSQEKKRKRFSGKLKSALNVKQIFLTQTITRTECSAACNKNLKRSLLLWLLCNHSCVCVCVCACVRKCVCIYTWRKRCIAEQYLCTNPFFYLFFKPNRKKEKTQKPKTRTIPSSQPISAGPRVARTIEYSRIQSLEVFAIKGHKTPSELDEPAESTVRLKELV